MGRNTTRTQNLTRITELDDGDVIVIGPATGDPAKGITFTNFQDNLTTITEGQNIIETSGDYTVATTDDIIVDTGPGTVSLPLSSQMNKQLVIRSNVTGGALTVAPATGETINGVEASLNINIDTSNTLVPVTGGWLTI